MSSAQADAPGFPAVLHQLAVFERSGAILSGPAATAMEASPSDASPLRGAREMAAAALCVSD